MKSSFPAFIGAVLARSFTGSPRYFAWMGALTVLALIGAHMFVRQSVEGLAITGMTDQVSWGLYIANFTFLVGVAAAAVVLVIPVYIYRRKEMSDIVIYGELLAVTAIILAMLFVLVDLGRPERAWHMIPGVGLFNFPISMLAWDVLVLNVYLLLNLYICFYLVYRKYTGQPRVSWQYIPFVIMSIVWAIAIHTVTAFLFVALVARPFWHEAIVAPRFLGSAFTAGPAILIIMFYVIRAIWGVTTPANAIVLLRHIVTAALLINLFLLGAEAFKEFYAASSHSVSAYYLFFGLEHQGEYYGNLVPWIWAALTMELIAAVILLVPPLARRTPLLLTACVLANIGIWIEKGMGLVIPGFVPTPQGLVVEYAPHWPEILVSIGIWAFGLLLFSAMLHVVVPIIKGEFRADAAHRPALAVVAPPASACTLPGLAGKPRQD